MAFSAIFILIFHLWINITNYELERFLRQLCVIGVDLFFLVSSFSIAKIKREEVISFIKNRVIKVYIPFIVFAIIAAIYYKWSIFRFVEVICGVELLKKGGGSFLWFIPSIMIVYLTLPFYNIIDNKYPKIMPIISFFLAIIIAVIISVYTNYDAIFIFINRIPIILLGYYFSKYNILEKLYNKHAAYWLLALLISVVGLIISYLIYKYHFTLEWYHDFFYLAYIPLVLGVFLILDQIKVNRLGKIISNITLELYGMQMIFGFSVASLLLKYISNKLLCNIAIIAILIIISFIIKQIFIIFDKLFRNRKYSFRLFS